MSRDDDRYTDSQIDASCYELVDRLFGIDRVGLTNASMLTDFDLADPDQFDADHAGHRLIPLAEIPESERGPYAAQLPDWAHSSLGYQVWYPPISAEEFEEIRARIRQRLIHQLEAAYGVSFADYPEDALYVWKVAQFIARKLQERSGRE